MFQIDTTTNYSSSDYNGFGANAGASNFAWNSPPDGVAADFDYTHKLAVRRFPTLKDYAGATAQDRHSVMLDYKVFVSVPRPDRSDPQRLYNPEDMDFHLRPRSAPKPTGRLALQSRSLERRASWHGAAHHQRQLCRKGAGPGRL